MEGVWIFGGIERTEKKKLFLVKVKDRKESTLLELIKKHVKPGSHIVTDGWRGYYNLSDEIEYKHSIVNHSIGFKNSENEHTNTIEGSWNGVKLNIPVRCRTYKKIDGHLFELIWRRINEKRLWEAFIKALIKNIHYFII